ncbi:MAG: PD-(D/E)XK nuclease family protein [Chloroflexota bacterium]|nr:PD-(D/E)XK nuclease family protein [Chloroflexota bacterium]
MKAQDQYAALEKFSIEHDLNKLGQLLSQFNLFDTLDLHWREPIHSRILGWLLSPKENHGINDGFLKQFLKTTFPSENIIGDWSDAKVHEEWNNTVDHFNGRLDLLVTEESRHFLCAIENKVWSEEHSNQLTRYRRAVEEKYPNFQRRYVFLSPRGTKPSSPEEQGHWKTAGYDAIRKSVSETLEACDSSTSEEVRFFLHQYVAMLEKRILGNREARELVEKLHRKHPTAIDFIVANLPNHQTRSAEIEDILKEIIQGINGWEVSYCNFQAGDGRRLTRSLHQDWKSSGTFRTGKGWGKSEAITLLEFWCYKDSLELHISVGPGTNQEIRESLHGSLKTIGGLEAREQEFDPSRPWFTFTVERGLLDKKDFEDWDLAGIRQKLEKSVRDFDRGKFQDIHKAIIECLAKYDQKPTE